MKFVEVTQDNESAYWEMYPEYVRILHGYDPSILLPTYNEIKARLKIPHSKIYLLQHRENIVGFIILGFGLENSFSGHDVYIEEFFIRPQYQKMRFGTKAIVELVKKYPENDFSAFVIDKNDVAQNFWETTFARCGYNERTLAGHITAKSENLLFKYWVKNHNM